MKTTGWNEKCTEAVKAYKSRLANAGQGQREVLNVDKFLTWLNDNEPVANIRRS